MEGGLEGCAVLEEVCAAGAAYRAMQHVRSNQRLASFFPNQKAFIPGLRFSLLCPGQDRAVLSGPLAVN